MPIFEYVTVVAGGVVYDGWETVQIEWTTFESEVNALLTTSELGPWSDTSVFDEWNFPPGTEIQIYAGPTIIFWGSVYSYEPKADPESHTVTLICKTMSWKWAVSAAQVPTSMVENTTDEAFVQLLANASGMWVANRVNPMTGQGPVALPWYMIRQGATNYQAAMDVLVTNQKMLMAHAFDGSLIIHDGIPFKMSGAVVQGVNILRMSAKLKDTQFDSVEVVGQNAIQNAYDTGIAPFAVVGQPGKFRKVIDMTATTKSIADKRAQWELRRSIGDAIQAIIVVPGWRDLDGALWMANQDVFVTAPWLQINCTLRTMKVVFNQDLASGTTTELTLVDPRTVMAASINAATVCDNGPIWDPGGALNMLTSALS